MGQPSPAFYPQFGMQWEDLRSALGGLSLLSVNSSGKRRKYFLAAQSLLRKKAQPCHPWQGVHRFAAHPCRLAAACGTMQSLHRWQDQPSPSLAWAFTALRFTPAFDVSSRTNQYQ